MAALVYLTPYFYYIPKTSLAAVIIAASFMMVDVNIVKHIYRSKSTYILNYGTMNNLVLLVLFRSIGISHRKRICKLDVN